MKRSTALALAALALGCTDVEGPSYRALRAQGFTDVELQGYAWLGCGSDDTFRTRFRASNVQGEVVSGVVCCSWTKACTVRF